jgi:ketosteroid isomerase-like protein
MTDPREWLSRLVEATNAHDLDALVACFALDYENTAPTHPARGFVGREQVRTNWTQIFDSVPDLKAEVVAATFDGATAWTQWDMAGTRRDGSPMHMAGVIVFDVRDGEARAARFFLEPVDDIAGTVDGAIRREVAR